MTTPSHGAKPKGPEKPAGAPRSPVPPETAESAIAALQRITPEQLQWAKGYQKTHGGRLGAALVRLGFVTSDEITALLSRQYGVPPINLSQVEIGPAVIKLVPAETARKYQIVPVSRTGATLTIAMTDPTNVFVMDDIRFMTGFSVEPVVASEAAVQEAIDKYYGRGATSGGSALDMASRVLEEMPVAEGDVEVLDGFEEISAETLMKQGEDAPIVRLVNALMMSAIQRGASDIHVEPYEKDYRVRYLIDGVLFSVMTPSMKFRDAIASRLKIMAKLDIAEKRLPQDGRIKLRYADRGVSKDISFRVSVLPTLFGESIVMRLLDRERLMLDMTKLGFEPEPLARFEAAVQRPWGMVLVTVPTGSGKTNTLYSAISRLNRAETKILTAEDPVEFNLSGINQVQIRESIGLTFATALRAFLRQDPNIILVGEIRDFETAEIAIKAALTGHLVLSTVHTNDAASTVGRLVNMGIEPFLVASAVNLVCAQRLVRRICRKCAKPAPVPAATPIDVGFSPELARTVVPRVGAGCEACGGTGYRGRVGLYEVMEMTDSIRDLVLAGASNQRIRRKALEEGMITLRASGIHKITDGVTTIEEVLRETTD